MSSLPVLSGRVLVTGATGSIGQAIATKVVQAGGHAVLCSRTVEKLEQFAVTLPAGATTLAPFDLTRGEEIANWMRELSEKDGPFSGVAHTAGIHATQALRTADAAMIDKMFNMNVTSGIMLGKGLRQKVCHTDGASYVLLGSTASYANGGGMLIYAASKGAVEGSARAMAHELLRDRIRVNCVVPALIDSPMTDKVSRTVPPEAWKTVVDKHLLGVGKPEDVADAVVYMLSDQTRWMTGTDIVLDGGYSLR